MRELCERNEMRQSETIKGQVWERPRHPWDWEQVWCGKEARRGETTCGDQQSLQSLTTNTTSPGTWQGATSSHHATLASVCLVWPQKPRWPICTLIFPDKHHSERARGARRVGVGWKGYQLHSLYVACPWDLVKNSFNPLTEARSRWFSLNHHH